MTRTRALLAVVLAAVSLPGGAPASASQVSPHMDVWVDRWTGNTATVCAEGHVDNGSGTSGQWVYTIQGQRSDGTLISLAPVTQRGQVFSRPCDPVSTAGTAAGHFMAKLAYSLQGASEAADDSGPFALADLAGSAAVEVVWSPATAFPMEQSYSTSR